MAENLNLALQITLVGMGLVFAAIILLWWMMALLTRVMAEKEPFPESDDELSLTRSPSPAGKGELAAQAAAVAVALALAEQQVSHAHPFSIPPTAIVSAWQLGMRTRQLSQKGRPVLRNPRNIG
jgi:Na+-transporting methylmalonyl-CoA/oxaloacetate decarboxylase gamma subunit